MFNSKLYYKTLSTKTIGQNLIYFDELDSTNTKALELAKNNIENGSVVITDNQTSGRGRQSNKWFSVPGKSLTFSIILYPNCSSDEISKYSILSGLAVYDTLSDYNIIPKLKWPNDVFINNRKICGILCESKLIGVKISTLVIGIGININESDTDIPEDLKLISTSLLIESGQQNRIEIVLANIINKFEVRLNRIENFANQVIDWKKNCAHLNSEVSFKYNNEIITGIFKGLTPDGRAILSIDGLEITYNSGEIIQL